MRIAITQRAAPKPPAHLSRNAKAIWKQIVESKPVGTFHAAELLLLEAYCTTFALWRESAVLAARMPRKAARDQALFAQETKRAAAHLAALTSLAVRLRLSPSSRVSKHEGDAREIDIRPVSTRRKGLLWGE